MSKVKGTGVGAVYEFLSSQGGAEGMAKIKAALAPEDQAIFEKPILPISWVDFGYYMRMIVTADRILGRGDFKLVEEAARFNMQKNFRGSYKVFLTVLSPAAVLKISHIIWTQWFDRGKLTNEWLGDRHLHMKLTDFPDMPAHHEHNLTPSIEEIVRLAGAKNIRCEHQRCILKEGYCLWNIEWS